MIFLVSDIDLTCAIPCPERLKDAGKMPDKSNPLAFQKWLDRLQGGNKLLRDAACVQMRELLNSLVSMEDVKMCYVTGRSVKYAEQTNKWLRLNGFPEAPLFMREGFNEGTEDLRDPHEYKEEEMKRAMRILRIPEDAQVIVFDDDAGEDCAPMYKRNGWLHCKVTNELFKKTDKKDDK